jgi:lipopolysaccharide transport system ATP-binding protein
MSSDRLAIRADRLSKRYRLGERSRYRTLREALVDTVSAPFRARHAAPREMIWALRDVSFEIGHGEVVGVIGRNGAGKSTLLKILSRITEPTSGRAELRGRVGSLLEVGTGFHSELTGRDNIYLSGAILGMRRAEIGRKFDEIVAFAEVERFIDTPVKHYSSGMYLRLAFAVAAHLEPDILLVDEVLAVGDAAFQRRCLRKMEDVAHGGRAVLLVSHNMAAIEGLCSSAMLLDGGRLVHRGAPADVIARYIEATGATQGSSSALDDHPGRRPGSRVVLRSVTVSADGAPSTVARMGSAVRVVTRFASGEPIRHMRFGLAVESALGQRLVNFSPSHQAPTLFPDVATAGVVTCDIPSLPLLPGTYFLTLIIGDGANDLDRIDRAVEFTVEPADVFGTGQCPGAGHGVFFLPATWSFERAAT